MSRLYHAPYISASSTSSTQWGHPSDPESCINLPPCVNHPLLHGSKNQDPALPGKPFNLKLVGAARKAASPRVSCARSES
mmetsp:Transcript_5554/g.13835  ORF Transcript_5554/g.13835 Transcript_5554/m.13835 type:complete len:80 (-) Transcript_5554:1185-1424(-)